MKICMILDIDGVLNQYRRCERIRRDRKLKYSEIFTPYPKKVKRLSKYIKKYNIDIFLFSAWTKEEIEECTTLKIKEDTRKSVKYVNSLTKEYDEIIFIEDEPNNYIKAGINFTKLLQPHYEFGLTKKDFKKLKDYLNKL